MQQLYLRFASGRKQKSSCYLSILASTMLLFMGVSGFSQTPTIIISQYTETNSGTTPKGIELWNPTATDIDFSMTGLEILKGTNGAAPSSDFTLNTGTLAAGETLIVGTSDMNPLGDCECCSFQEKAFTFNGDDALVIQLGGVTTDVFGDPGTGDPGSNWNGNGVATNNNNIQLKAGITTGDTDGWTDPSERFENVAVGTDLTGFGIPPGGCPVTGVCSITNFMITAAPTCNDAPFQDESSFEVSFEVSNGSGDYFLVNPVTSITYGREPSGPTDGLVTILGGASSGAMPGTTAMVQVFNSVGMCTSEVLMIDVPICPDCMTVPDAPMTSDLVYCVDAIASPLTAAGEVGATFNWYDVDPATATTAPTALPGAPTPTTDATGSTSFYVTQTVEGCESEATALVVTVNGLSGVSVTQNCVDAFTYDLDVCFTAVNPGPSGMFSVLVGDDTFGPYAYTGNEGMGTDEYCVNIAAAGNPTNEEELDVVVKDSDVTDGTLTVTEDRIVAFTSFENGITGDQYVDTGDAMVDHDLVNNPGQAEVDFMGMGTELGVDAFFLTAGNSDGLTDGDFTGFTGFTGEVGAYTDGTQGYQLSDTDGTVELSFDEVDVSVCESVEFTMDLFVQATGWEAADAIYIYLVYADASEQVLLDTRGLDIDNLNIEDSWMTLSATIMGQTTAQLMVEFTSNSGSEVIYMDNISFSGIACATAGTEPEMCSAETTFTEEACFDCPEIGMATDEDDVCEGETFDLMVTGLSGFAATMNLETDFGVDFVYFSGAAPANPYEGGTSLGMVMNADFTGADPDQMAMLEEVGADLVAGSYTICAILDPTSSADAACMPSACLSIMVNPLPTIDTETDIFVCDGGSTEITPTSGMLTVMAQADDLLISQYIEGSGFNKCIEIFNGTGAEVDLSNYTVALYSNGSATPTGMFTLPATTLADGAVYTICNMGASPALLAIADLTNNTTMNFNGNDAVAILGADMSVVDAIGQIGNGDSFATNITLIRNADVATGNDGTAFFSFTDEYMVLGEDVFTDFGMHTFNATEEVAATVYNFYSDEALTDLLAGEVASYDPETTVGDSPQVIYVTAVDVNTTCQSTAVAVTVTVEACELVVADPCSCNDDNSAITYDAATGVYTNPNDGTFGEVVSITGTDGAPLPDGFDFRVTAVADAIGVAIGDMLVYNAAEMRYDLVFNHPDDIGYSLTIDLFENDQALGLNLMISNACAYPNPIFDPALDAIYCAFEEAITLGADVSAGFAGSDDVSFTINGEDADEFDPTALGAGDYEVVLTFDGAEDGNGGISPDGGTTPAFPGCTQVVITNVEVANLNVGCIGDINVTLGANCESTITPSMVLNGGFACADDFVIRVDGADTDQVAGCGDHTYEIDVIVAGEVVYSCWGNLFAEDKTAPEVDCPADATSVDVVVETYPINGELTATDPTLAISNWSCFQDFFSPLAGDHPYDVLEFTVGATDFYTFDVDSDFGDAAMTMYQGGFDVDNPCQNIIGTNGDDFATQGTPFDPRLRFSLPLIAGETYQIVVTNWAPGDLGEYVVNIFADNNGSISGINAVATTQTFDLFCDDVDYIRFTTPQSWVVNADGTIDEDTSIDEFFGGDDDAFEDFVEKLSRAGLPTATDNCGQILITVVDGGTTGNGDCGDIQMTRTFTIQDRYDNCTDSNGEPSGEDCTQVITFRRPTLGDVEIPPFLVVVECDEEYPTDGATGGPDENVSAALAGYPFIRTAAGFQDLNQNYCNIGASYSDEPRVVVCEGTFNYRREWNIIDWCNPGGSGTLDQFIKVGDFTGPAIDAPALVEFSTSPFGCEANINVPTLPVSDVGGCSSAFPTSYTVFANGETLFATGTYVLQGGVYVASPAVVAAPIGEHTIEFCAEDACGNETCVIVDVTVEDNIEPSAACDDELNVSIGGGDVANDIEGQARIFAIDVNEGSNDNCGEVTLEVRRNFWRNDDCDPSASRWSPWGDFVDFYCCDIGNEITIELRVTDEAGNENVCWMVVTPEDKINPFCYAPDPMTITCSDLPFSFPGDIATAYEEDFDGTSEMMDGLFGGASGTDNCAVDAVVERQPSININECGWGSITRRFEVWQARPEGDVNGNGELDANEAFRSTNSCSQLITITEVHDFTIDFPEDADADCGAPDVPTIITDAVGCDVLAVNIGEPVRFAATGDECYKMSITYDVINWCLWDGEYTGYVLPRMTEDDGEGLAVDRAVEGNERPVITYTDAQGLCIDRRHADRDGDSSLSNCDSPTLENYGRYIYTQFIKVYDTTVPVVTVDPYGGPTAQCPDLEEGQFGDYFGTCDAPVSFTFSVTDDCELFNMAGDLVISIASAELDAFAVDASGDGEIVSSEFEADLDVLSNITDNGDGTYVFAGTFPVITSAMGENIIHAVRILFEDGCGNQTSIYVEFDVVDCAGPAPICINGLTVTLMPQQEGGCAMAIWASDFEASPISDCTGQGPEEFLGNPRVTKYAIYRASTVEADPDFVPNPADTGLVLTDEDDETTVVYVYAFDEEGNYDYCETYVLVQLNDLCLSNGNGSISGVIATEEGDTVEGAEVNLSGAMVTSLTTNGDGSFSFENLTVGGDYSVAPYLNSGFLNGVSTFDLVLMSKHILGVQPLNSAYKMIAADINNSRTVTTLDMIQLRKLILNIDTEFANNTSWRFVAASHNFSDISNPWLTEFPEVENFNNITVDALVADFVGVKIGDVNGSAAANAQSGDDRTLNGQFNLDVEDINMKAGNTYTVAVTAAEVEGFQGTLALKGADLVNIEYAAATAENFGTHPSPPSEGGSYLAMSWNGDIVKGDPLFSLVIRATQDAQLSEVLSVNSRYTVAEAYEGNNTMDLGINFSGLTVEAGFEVYQNTPNPFQAETLIGFNLPVDAEVTVTISDVSGRVLNVIRTDAAAGYNTINVTKDMVQGATGVLTYTVTAGLRSAETATKTMISVK